MSSGLQQSIPTQSDTGFYTLKDRHVKKKKTSVAIHMKAVKHMPQLFEFMEAMLKRYASGRSSHFSFGWILCGS